MVDDGRLLQIGNSVTVVDICPFLTLIYYPMLTFDNDFSDFDSLFQVVNIAATCYALFRSNGEISNNNTDV